MTDELKRCPFCKLNTAIGIAEIDVATIPHWIVQCRSCGANGSICSSEAEAITAWNRCERNEPILCKECDGSGDMESDCCHCGMLISQHDGGSGHPAVPIPERCEKCRGTGFYFCSLPNREVLRESIVRVLDRCGEHSFCDLSEDDADRILFLMEGK